MTPGGIKHILARQRADGAQTVQRRLRNIVLLLLTAGLAYGIERQFSLHDVLHDMLAGGEASGADALLLTALLALFGYVVVQVLDLRREVSRRRLAEAQAIALAYHDPLTGLPNRRRFEEHLGKLNPGQTIAVLMLDLDDFKPVNDMFGHGVGDEVLSQAARRIAATCGRDCMVARFGGDEFAVATGPAISGEEAVVLAQAIGLAFEEPFPAGTAMARIGISAGVALFTAGERPAMEALREADLALYRAKLDRQQRWCLFDRRFEETLRRRKTLEVRLATATNPG
jgi:diguanylate cyclase (GGDEF)-like protein